MLDRSDRATLAAVIGEHAEGHVYLYASCDRDATYPGLAARDRVLFRDRFTAQTHVPSQDAVAAFVELTAANELDVMVHNRELREHHGPQLLRLLGSARHWLSDGAWNDWRALGVDSGETGEPHGD